MHSHFIPILALVSALSALPARIGTAATAGNTELSLSLRPQLFSNTPHTSIGLGAAHALSPRWYLRLEAWYQEDFTSDSFICGCTTQESTHTASGHALALGVERVLVEKPDFQIRISAALGRSRSSSRLAGTESENNVLLDAGLHLVLPGDLSGFRLGLGATTPDADAPWPWLQVGWFLHF